MLQLKFRYHAMQATAQLHKKKSRATNAASLCQLIPVISLLGLKHLHYHHPALVSIACGNIIIHLALLSKMMFLSKHGKEKQHVTLKVLLTSLPMGVWVPSLPPLAQSRRGQPAMQTHKQALPASCSLSAKLLCTCCKSPSVSHSLAYYAISPQRCNHI